MGYGEKLQDFSPPNGCNLERAVEAENRIFQLLFWSATGHSCWLDDKNNDNLLLVGRYKRKKERFVIEVLVQRKTMEQGAVSPRGLFNFEGNNKICSVGCLRYVQALPFGQKFF